MEHRLAFKTAAILATGLGLGGNDFVTDTSAHSGDWWCFHAFSDCVFTTLTYRPGTSGGSIGSAVLKGGDRIYGNIIAVKLASGEGELYRTSI